MKVRSALSAPVYFVQHGFCATDERSVPSGVATVTTSTDTKHYELVNTSYGRCVSSTGFFETFYRLLLASHPDIPPMFANTDFERQNELLRASLGVMVSLRRQEGAGYQILEEVRRSHCRSRMNVRPELYSFWVDCLIESVKRHDPKFDQTLEAAWRDVISKGVDYIKDGYDVTPYDR